MTRRSSLCWGIILFFVVVSLAATRFEDRPPIAPVNELLGSPYNDYLGPPIVARVVAIEDLNGDLDSFPDTGETAQIRIALSNKTSTEYTNVQAAIWSLDPTITRVTASVAVGTIPANSEVIVTAPIEFKVSGFAERGGAAVTCASGTCSNFVKRSGDHGAIVPCTSAVSCRRTPDQAYFGRLEFSLVSDQANPLGSPLVIPIELDLNVSNAAAATTTFSHGFEGALAPFVLMTLDTNKASNSLSIGYRCQKSEVDYPYSLSYGETECYLGFASGSNPNDWHLHDQSAVDGGRARTGNGSLHLGLHDTVLGPGYDTTGLSQLDAVRSGNLNVAARVCRDDPSPNPLACNVASDCAGVGGGPCVAASPVLLFAHQVSLSDDRTRGIGNGQAADRAVVQAKALPGGNWEDLPAFYNVYDAEGELYFSNCTFDPVDDGNNEKHWFPETTPINLKGPSSTCAGARVFSYLGDTDEPFDAGKIGRASDGPGLAGSLGTGTWVESRFDLTRYRGRSIQIRFLFTSIKVNDVPNLQQLFMHNPYPGDDGWYIDDVQLTQSAGSTPTATMDEAPAPLQTDVDADGVDDAYDNCPNLANPDQGDADRDGNGNACETDDDADGHADASDCASLDLRFWSPPTSARDIRAEALPPDLIDLTWQQPADGGTLYWYTIHRGPDPVAFDQCFLTANTSHLSNYRPPSVGVCHFYLVTARNNCGENSGVDSSGTPRTPAPCPP